MKIAFFKVEDWEKKEIKKRLGKHKLVFFDEHLNNKHLPKLKDVDVLGVFVWSKITKNVLDAMPKLKLIATRSTGFDHIDLEECKKRKITVCNVPTYGENTVAEHTFALILALSRKIFQAIQRTHEQESFETDEKLRGFDLKGKTIGIVGLGNIGKHVARIAAGFEMDIIAFDLNKDMKFAKPIGLKYVDMDQLLAKSDIITLHVPDNRYTHHMINDNAIAKMKKGVHIVNTSRGGVIDTDALVHGLKTGKVAGAGLDVLEEEVELKEEVSLLHKEFKDKAHLNKILEEHMLMKMDNVVVTPHNAFNSNEALQRIMDTTIENIIKFNAKRVINRVV